MELLNTHTYDGQWKAQLSEVLAKCGGIRPLTNLPDFMLTSGTHKPFIDMLLSGNGNMDSVNGVDARDLFILLVCQLEELKKKYTESEFNSIYELSMEQIADIANGPCPQGRTTRIFQVLYALVSQ